LSFLHIVFRITMGKGNRTSRQDIRRLFYFYVVTVVGSIVSIFYTGMPGTWTAAAISVVLIYLDDQNREILHGMITAMAADYRSLYFVDLDKDECNCVQAPATTSGQMWEKKVFSFRDGFTNYALQCVSKNDRESFLQFINPDNIRSRLAAEPMISHRYLAVKDGVEQYEMLSIASVNTSQYHDEHDKIRAIGMGFSNVDLETREELTQKHALSEALTKAEEANAAKTAFLSSMSHEIRTPMNAIIGLDNIALRDKYISPDIRDNLEKIGSSARHLLSLINDILDMSRIESGRMVLKSEEFSFRDMTDQINTIIHGQCDEKGLTYVNQLIECNDAYFIGDDLRLRQIIINILGNAVKFTDPPGTVTFIVEQISCDNLISKDNKNISYDKDGDDGKKLCILRFTMRDTGIGMDEAFLPQLFEPFSQEDATSTNRYGGSGLGMALTKNMVDLMGGTIIVDSKKGQGTTFTVEVPLIRAEHPEDLDNCEDSNEQSETLVSLEGLHVLIAEDVDLNAEILTDLLEMEGVTSEWVKNGQLAVEKFVQNPPGHFDFILMDVRMPVMDGLTATGEIRKLERPDAATIPIIALTANAFEEDMRRCLSAGMDAHLPKPVDIDQMKKVLGRVLKG
ncbi:MAG: response regulator, partial [Lachnospiraceae bacterium]|nr:response regulator [Lachnospiraceae bacterium]